MYFSLNLFTQSLLSAFAKAASPKEAIGLMGVKFDKNDWTRLISTDQVVELDNLSTTPEKNFLIYQREVNRARYWKFHDYHFKQTLWLWHTHPSGAPILSHEDQAVIYESKMPMLILGLHPHPEFRVYSMGRPRPDGKRPIHELPIVVETGVS